MSNQLFNQLEEKIDHTLETIELLRLQIEELEENNSALKADNAALKARQTQWENSLSTLLRKLDRVDVNSHSHAYEREEEEIGA